MSGVPLGVGLCHGVRWCAKAAPSVPAALAVRSTQQLANDGGRKCAERVLLLLVVTGPAAAT